MIMKKLTYIIAVLSIFTFYSCEEKIDFDLNNQENSRLVVEGSITDQAKAHVVKLTRTTSYYENQPAPKETGATVTISDGTSTHTLTETSAGVYETAPTYKGEIGKSYTLEITTKDNDSYSATSTIYSVAPIDTIGAIYEEGYHEGGAYYHGGYTLMHFGPEPAGIGNNYMWLVDLNGKSLTKNVSEITFVTDEFVDGNYINGFEFHFIDELDADSILALEDTLKLTVEMHSISRGYYEFMLAIMLETDWRGGLFDGPPANIPSNISNGALGYFRASAVSSMYQEIHVP